MKPPGPEWEQVSRPRDDVAPVAKERALAAFQRMKEAHAAGDVDAREAAKAEALKWRDAYRAAQPPNKFAEVEMQMTRDQKMLGPTLGPLADSVAHNVLGGMGDELVGAVGGAGARDRFKRSMAAYQQTDPRKAGASAFGGAVAGGAAMGGMAGTAARGLGAGNVMANMVAGAVPGAVQGIGEAEDGLGNRLIGGALGGGIGAAGGALMTGAANQASKIAQRVAPNARAASAQGQTLVREVLERPTDTMATRAAFVLGGLDDETRFAAQRGVLKELQEVALNETVTKTQENAIESLIDGVFTTKADRMFIKQTFREVIDAPPSARAGMLKSFLKGSERSGAIRGMAQMAADRAADKGKIFSLPGAPGIPGGVQAPLAGAMGAVSPDVPPLLSHLFLEDK